MSGIDGKKPETREDFIKLLASAKKEERKARRSQGSRSTKPTIKGTAEVLGIHRDTLYQWMREFDVDFSDVDERKMVVEEAIKKREPTYLIGEALMRQPDVEQAVRTMLAGPAPVTARAVQQDAHP